MNTGFKGVLSALRLHSCFCCFQTCWVTPPKPHCLCSFRDWIRCATSGDHAGWRKKKSLGFALQRHYGGAGVEITMQPQPNTANLSQMEHGSRMLITWLDKWCKTGWLSGERELIDYQGVFQATYNVAGTWKLMIFKFLFSIESPTSVFIFHSTSRPLFYKVLLSPSVAGCMLANLLHENRTPGDCSAKLIIECFSFTYIPGGKPGAEPRCVVSAFWIMLGRALGS